MYQYLSIVLTAQNQIKSVTEWKTLKEAKKAIRRYRFFYRDVTNCIIEDRFLNKPLFNGKFLMTARRWQYKQVERA
jgi:hypothetical protein